ncbi:Equilibrative nucleoside transporter 1 [Merluccius polli]|uniref:Equilibrative nucleoside transporter 1 n=1 Tax=Merluccius polli TaxID=89951 RepID=A0AA47P782_MERPO|nr:Equilibrative nucleoside transporter 1 [Merluccius polli]
MTALDRPNDRYNAVWIIFFILGLGTLLPWNFFMTATMYFTSRLKDMPGDARSNLTGNMTGEVLATRNVLESKFNNVITLCAMVPLLIFTCLNSFIHQRIPQKLRISGSLVVILVVFLLTAIMVKVPVEPLPFFTLTMIKIICINCESGGGFMWRGVSAALPSVLVALVVLSPPTTAFGAVLQGSLFGLAGRLPASYTTPIMSGQGLAGTFAAFSMICALASGSALQDSAFGYFITACVVILLAILSYIALPKMEFFQYYMESNGSGPSGGEENRMDLLKKEGSVEKGPAAEEARPTSSVVSIFKQIWVLALSVCFIFTITIGTFPAVTVEVKSSLAKGGAWDTYFIPVSCFLLFNVMDWAGRSLTAFCMWPGKDSRWLPALVVMRLVFVPLFMLCNVQPRSYLPVWFNHDVWYIVFMIVFSFSNGYLASLCMCFGPKKVPQHEAETAGAIMAFFLSLGLALGAALSFAFRALV